MRELPSSVARAVLWNDAMGNRAVVAMSCLIAACTLAEPGVPLGVPAAPAAPHVSVDGDPPALLTQRGDSARSGANAFERALSVSTVTPSTFGKLFTRAIDGDVYAQPLYVAGVAFADRTRNVLVVATEHDSVFAFDADDPSADAPLWKVTIGQATPVPNPWFAVPTDFDACRTATYNQRASGITSTPVIDPTTSTIYVVGLVQDRVATTTYADCVDVDPESDYRCLTSACDGPVFRVELHALDLVTGAERSGSPAVVGGSVLGNGDASENGVVTFDPRIHLQRPGLLLSGGRVYIGFGSYGDIGLYHGWIFAYDAATLARAAVFNSTPDGTAGSVWQSGVGLAADEDGYVYAVTGNGTFDADRGGRDYGDSVIKLDRDLNVVDWFTPYLASLNGTDYLSVWDADLGSGGVLLVAGTRKLAVAGKTGVLYLLDRDNLGHLEPPTGAGRSVERFAPALVRAADAACLGERAVPACERVAASVVGGAARRADVGARAAARLDARVHAGNIDSETEVRAAAARDGQRHGRDEEGAKEETTRGAHGAGYPYSAHRANLLHRDASIRVKAFRAAGGYTEPGFRVRLEDRPMVA